MSETNPDILNDYFRNLHACFKEYQQVCTDESKEDPKVGFAVISDKVSKSAKIRNRYNQVPHLTHCKIERPFGVGRFCATKQSLLLC